ncbi:hypothetical protein V8B97DRAFT_1864107 [Scleroderma yunnanense]
MPAKSALFEGEKNIVKSIYTADKNKILFATPARIYFAYPQQNRWTYGGLQGALAFIEDLNKSAFFLKLVDIFGSKGELWSHELYEGFEYYQDQPFFHSFAGDKCMIGLVFSDQKDAKLFYKKVTTRKTGKVPKSTKKSVSKGGKVDKTMISGPVIGSFKHLGHMEYDPEKGFVSEGVDGSWEKLASALAEKGVPENTIQINKEWIREWLLTDGQEHLAQDTSAATKKKAPPPPVPRRAAHGPSESVASVSGDAQAAPTLPPGRADLLASIRGQGVQNLRKTPKTDCNGAPSQPPTAPVVEETRSGGGDLTAALAAALLQRNKKLGESDDEEDDDEEWD